MSRIRSARPVDVTSRAAGRLSSKFWVRPLLLRSGLRCCVLPSRRPWPTRRSRLTERAVTTDSGPARRRSVPRMPLRCLETVRGTRHRSQQHNPQEPEYRHSQEHLQRSGHDPHAMAAVLPDVQRDRVRTESAETDLELARTLFGLQLDRARAADLLVLHPVDGRLDSVLLSTAGEALLDHDGAGHHIRPLISVGGHQGRPGRLAVRWDTREDPDRSQFDPCDATVLPRRAGSGTQPGPGPRRHSRLP